MKFLIDNWIYIIILLPIIVGFLNIILFRRFLTLIKVISFIVTLFVLILFILPLFYGYVEQFPNFNIDNLSMLTSFWVCFFSLLILIYSIGYIKDSKIIPSYFGYFLITLGASLGALMSNNIILFIVFWGFLGLTLYLMVLLSGEKSKVSAKKAFIIIGGSDMLMILGLIMCFFITDSKFMVNMSIPITNNYALLAFIFIAIGAFAKAGAMPFHSWIPDVAEDAPTPVTAYLPASLDKILGIYLLSRTALTIFELNKFSMNLLMIFGSITIIFAVMMALIQHDMKRLLGYHAVSQVGYMVLGIGTGIPIGIAGGLFHMINHANYKSLLFLTSGSVEKKCNTTDLDKLGGLAKFMPYTFFAALIASLSISGVPPLNGFFSKWMVYQGIIETSKTVSPNLWIFYLAAAMFGSVLTLASFAKLLHSAYLGKPSEELENVKDVSGWMVVPSIVIAFTCIFLGLFSTKLFIPLFFSNMLPELKLASNFTSDLAGIVLIGSIMAGLIVYILLNKNKFRYDTTYIGGNELKTNERITGTDFYNTIKEIKPLNYIYHAAEKKFFDLYELLKNFTFSISHGLMSLHSGVLPTYLGWYIFGIVLLLYIWFGGR